VEAFVDAAESEVEMGDGVVGGGVGGEVGHYHGIDVVFF